jgi:hypothetical protein
VLLDALGVGWVCQTVLKFRVRSGFNRILKRNSGLCVNWTEDDAEKQSLPMKRGVMFAGQLRQEALVVKLPRDQKTA